MIGEEEAMSVLCHEMVASKASGIIQSVYVRDGVPDSLAVYAAFGLGRTVVEGRTAPDRFIIERKAPNQISSTEIARKESLIVPLPGGGEKEIRVAEENQMQPAISENTIAVLVKWALALERYFKRPQEIEWAVDDTGHCWLLQSRRLIVPEITDESREDICESCSLYPVLIQGQGAVAHAGVGSGIVHIVNSNDDMNDFQDGTVLVTRYTAPWLGQVAPMASAIIAETGSVAGHLATIAREFRVPTLVGVENAAEILPNGMEITLDTHHRIVYAGRVRELIRYELVQSMVFEESPEFRLLRRMLKRVAPLHLIDPQSSDFTPEGCTSVHDLIRFIHEKAVMELIDLPAFLKRFKGAKVWTLDSNIPIDLKILDIGGGIDPDATGVKAVIDQIQSRPLKALWAGISHPDTWDTEPVDIDFKGLMSSLGKNWDAGPGGLGTSGVNLAVVSRIYMNLHLHLGYHFNLIDVRMDDEPQHNHIYFRFVGGVTDLTRRSRRAQLLARILSHYHFNVAVKGDLVIGRLLHLPKEEIHRRLRMLGILIGFTRQLDIQLRSDRDMSQFIDMFFNRHAKFVEESFAEKPGGEHEWQQA
jgi:pyruvate,water dikinase